MTQSTTWHNIPTELQLRVMERLAPADAASAMATCVAFRELGRKADTWKRAGFVTHKNCSAIMTCLSALAVPSLQRSLRATLRQPAAPYLSVAVDQALQAGDVSLVPCRDAKYVLCGFETALTDTSASLEMRYVHKDHGMMAQVQLTTDLAANRSRFSTSRQTGPKNDHEATVWTMPDIRFTGPTTEPHWEVYHESPERWFGPTPPQR